MRNYLQREVKRTFAIFGLMENLMHCDVLFFSRGRGKGHAVKDSEIIRELRRLQPTVRLSVASYGTGAEMLSELGEKVIDMRLDDMVSFPDTLVPIGTVLRSILPSLVVSHEEAGALPMAKVFDLPTVFLTHWFTAAHDIFSQCLNYADKVLFLEEKGLFPEPDAARGRVLYVGPVLRRFRYHPRDRQRIRDEMSCHPDEKLILVLPGSWTEKMAAFHDLILRSFDRLSYPRKRIIWVAAKDHSDIARSVLGRQHIEVVSSDMHIERLMIASDVAITKGSYTSSKELQVLGVPSITLSHGLNFMDDFFSKSIRSTTLLWVQETDAVILSACIERALNAGLFSTDETAWDGQGAERAAKHLADFLSSHRELSSNGAT